MVQSGPDPKSESTIEIAGSKRGLPKPTEAALLVHVADLLAKVSFHVADDRRQTRRQGTPAQARGIWQA
jgi:hypothetical protein